LSIEVHTSHLHPISGTPVEVPVPKNLTTIPVIFFSYKKSYLA
jgi:hypothetical protein